jgi:FixJ family two-component response regulator
MGFKKPVVFVSGYTDPHDLNWINRQADALFLSKPFTIAQLKHTLEKALQGERVVRHELQPVS